MSISRFFFGPLFDMSDTGGGSGGGSGSGGGGTWNGGKGNEMYAVTISKTLTGGGWKAQKVRITPPENPKDVFQIDIETWLVDPVSSEVLSTASAVLFRADQNVNGGASAPIQILADCEYSVAMPFIPFETPDPESCILRIKVTLTFSDNAQRIVETDIEPFDYTTNTHFTYFAGSNQSGTIPERPEGPAEIAITNVVPGDNGVGMMIDWSEDLTVGGFTVMARFDVDNQGEAKGQSVTGLDFVSGESFAHRPVEVILPYPADMGRSNGQAYNFLLTADFFVDFNGDPIEIQQTSGAYNVIQNAPANLPNMDFSI